MAQSNEKVPDVAPEVIRNTGELAAQAALRAQQMARRASQGDANGAPSKVPEVPARGGGERKAPEVPPKRLSLKKTFTPQEIATGVEAPVPIPQRNLPQKAPPVPQKPSSVQNSPMMAPKFNNNTNNGNNKENGSNKIIQATPLLIKPQGSPQLPARLKDTVTTSAISAANKTHQQSTSNISNRSTTSSISSLTNSPLPSSKTSTKPSSKTISPTEELGSEDALRGIETGLKNMERAMQEQMNLRSLEAAAERHRFNASNPLDRNMRTVGSIDRLDGSGNSNLRIMENLRLNFEASINMRMGRNLSMDQMQLESLQNSIRAGMLEPQQQQQQQQAPQHPPNYQFRSLDRHLPLELQYSRHRTEIDFLRHLDPRIQQQFLQRQQQAQAAAAAQAQQQQQQQGGSRDDVRLRRRSSHDETQFSQGGAAAAAGKCFFYVFFAFFSLI